GKASILFHRAFPIICDEFNLDGNVSLGKRLTGRGLFRNREPEMCGLVGVCAAGLVALGASSAGAAVIFTDNFAADPVPNPPNWVPNDPIFTNFFVGGGTVDLL